MFAHHRRARRRIHQFVHQTQTGHGVFGVAHGLAIAWSNLRLREFRGKRGAADKQRDFNARVFQIACRGHHLLRAFHQQPGQSDSVRLVLLIRLDQLFRRNLDSQIHDVIAVVFQDDLDKIFSNVVNVALHCGQHDFSALGRVRLFHELLEMAHCGFHGFGRLQNFRDDQFIGVEEPPHFRHTSHQRSIHDVQGCRTLPAFALQIHDQSVSRSFDDVIAKALVKWQVRRARFFFFLCRSKVLGNCRDVILIHSRALLLALLPPIGGNVPQELYIRMIGRHVFRRMRKQ